VSPISTKLAGSGVGSKKFEIEGLAKPPPDVTAAASSVSEQSSPGHASKDTSVAVNDSAPSVLVPSVSATLNDASADKGAPLNGDACADVPIAKAASKTIPPTPRNRLDFINSPVSAIVGHGYRTCI
jgi:hypothetical protein